MQNCNTNRWQGWRQPIPVIAYKIFGEDYLALDLFIHLLLHTRNEDMQQEEWYEGKSYRLKRGQVLFGKKKYAKRLRCSPSGVYKVLLRLQHRYGLVDTTASSNFTIVTWHSYDEITSMSTASGQQEDREKTASGTKKNVKSEKIENRPQWVEEILKWLSKNETIRNPNGYLMDIRQRYGDEFVARIWAKYKNSSAMCSASALHDFLEHYSKQK